MKTVFVCRHYNVKSATDEKLKSLNEELLDSGLWASDGEGVEVVYSKETMVISICAKTTDDNFGYIEAGITLGYVEGKVCDKYPNVFGDRWHSITDEQGNQIDTTK